MDPLTIAAWAAGAMLFVGAAGSLVRILRGPSLLDRAVATDVLLVVLSSAAVLEMAVHRHSDLIILVVLAAAVGFVGSVTIARFVEAQRPRQRRSDAEPVPGAPTTEDRRPL